MTQSEEWKLPEAPNLLPMSVYGACETLKAYASRLREIAEEEHATTVALAKAGLRECQRANKAERDRDAAVARAEAAEADNAAMLSFIKARRADYLADVGHDDSGVDVVTPYDEILYKAHPGDALRAESIAQTQKLIRDAAAAKEATANNSIHFGPVPEVEKLKAEVERLRKLEEIVKVGRYQFNDLHGKTLIDFLNLWLDQEKDKCQRLQAEVERLRAENFELAKGHLAAQHRAALRNHQLDNDLSTANAEVERLREQNESLAIEIERQPCYTCDECHQSINGEPHKVEELDNVDPTDDQVRIWCAACWKAERDAGDRLELEALVERDADALRAEVERLRTELQRRHVEEIESLKEIQCGLAAVRKERDELIADLAAAREEKQ